MVLLAGDSALDVATASDGRFGPEPDRCFGEWPAFCGWAEKTGPGAARTYRPEELGPPVLRPRQIFAVGLNYKAHAEEAGLELPPRPTIFTKFPSAITGPYGEIALPSGQVDWEVELVVVIGAGGHRIPEADAWSTVAGVTAGQDISEREVQWRVPTPQFSLGKSFPNFAPIGPCVVTPDELPDRDDIALACRINGGAVQDARTSDLVFSVPELIARLSAIVTLLPGDLIFTGTPSGVGACRTPPRFLQPGDVLDSCVAGVGSMQHRLVAGSPYEG